MIVKVVRCKQFSIDWTKQTLYKGSREYKDVKSIQRRVVLTIMITWDSWWKRNVGFLGLGFTSSFTQNDITCKMKGASRLCTRNDLGDLVTLQHFIKTRGRTWGGLALQVDQLVNSFQKDQTTFDASCILQRSGKSYSTWEMVVKCCSDTSPYWSITVSTDVCCGVYTPYYGSDLASQSRTAPTCLPITFATGVRREDSAGREGLVGQLERLWKTCTTRDFSLHCSRGFLHCQTRSSLSGSNYSLVFTEK